MFTGPITLNERTDKPLIMAGGPLVGYSLDKLLCDVLCGDSKDSCCENEICDFKNEANRYINLISHKKEDGKENYIFNVAGLTKDNINIEVKKLKLYITYKGRFITGEGVDLKTEIKMSSDVDIEKIEAKVDNGLLFITLGYKENLVKSITIS